MSYDSNNELCHTYRNGTYVKYDNKTGVRLKESNYLNGVLHGKYIIYENSKIKSLCTYKNGILDGDYIFHETQYITNTHKYIDGLQQFSIFTEYYDDQHTFKKLEYYEKNDKKNGPYEEWYSDGNIKLNCNYTDDVLDGEYIQYDKNGSIIINEIYKMGELEKNIIYEEEQRHIVYEKFSKWYISKSFLSK